MGYKCELFVNEVDSNLICPICHEVFEDPVNCKSGHTFCDDCIQQWLRNSNRCPMDNTLIHGASSLSRNLALNGVIINLEVRCNQAALKGEPRCIWRGKLEGLEVHRKKCSFQEVQCPNVNCDQQIQKRQLEEHDKICGFKKVECEECEDVLMRQDLEKHMEKDCPEALIPCPNKCTNAQGDVENIKRKNQEDHVNNTCGKTEVGCPFVNHGCSASVTREDVEKHTQNNMAAHVMLLAGICTELKEQNIMLAQRNAQLHDDLNKLKDDLESYVWTIQDYPSQYRRHSNGSYFRSPNFWLSGYSWYLRVYPNGEDGPKGLLTMNLCMNFEGGPRNLRPPAVISSREVVVSFTLSVISLSTTAANDVTSRKKETFSRNHPIHKASFTITEKDLEQFCDTENGILTIKCTIHVCVEK